MEEKSCYLSYFLLFSQKFPKKSLIGALRELRYFYTKLLFSAHNHNSSGMAKRRHLLNSDLNVTKMSLIRIKLAEFELSNSFNVLNSYSWITVLSLSIEFKLLTHTQTHFLGSCVLETLKKLNILILKTQFLGF